MAELVMREMARRAGRRDIETASAATSDEELGNPVYPPARKMLAAHGIDCAGKFARRLTAADYGKFDLIVGMDAVNIRNILRICGGDPAGKVSRLLDHTDRPGDVADPWYTGDFEATWRDVEEGCRALLAELPPENEMRTEK